MHSLIGNTYTYSIRNTTIMRKVLAFIRIKGVAMYELLDPTTHKHYHAYVNIFNKIFKSHRESVKKKGTKGKTIGSKQSFTA